MMSNTQIPSSKGVLVDIFCHLASIASISSRGMEQDKVLFWRWTYYSQ